MKEIYSVGYLIDQIDNHILEEKYPETEEMISDVENTAEVFMENIDTFNAFLGLIKAFPDQ